MSPSERLEDALKQVINDGPSDSEVSVYRHRCEHGIPDVLVIVARGPAAHAFDKLQAAYRKARP